MEVTLLVTLDQLVARFRSLGFLCSVETEGSLTLVMTGKLPSTEGNRLAGYRGPWLIDDPMGENLPEADGPSPGITIKDGIITFGFGLRAPGPTEPYERRFTTIDELYEELLHYWFDPDSPMSTEEGFIPGPGRPAGV